MILIDLKIKIKNAAAVISQNFWDMESGLEIVALIRGALKWKLEQSRRAACKC